MKTAPLPPNGEEHDYFVEGHTRTGWKELTSWPSCNRNYARGSATVFGMILGMETRVYVRAADGRKVVLP